MSFFGPIPNRDDNTVRQVAEVRREGPLRATRPGPLRMEPVVDLGHTDLTGRHDLAIPGRPGAPKGQDRGRAALEAGTMATGECRRLVEEEKLGVAVRRHAPPAPTVELQQADQPALDLPWA